MGENIRIYRMHDGRFIGFFREQGGYLMFAKIPLTEELVFAYANPDDDERFELLAAIRLPKSQYGVEDMITIMDRRTGSVKNTKAEYLGYAYQAGNNRYKPARWTHTLKIQ